MSTPKRRFNLLSLTFIVLCFKKSLLIRVQRIVSKIPKRGKKGSIITDLRRRLRHKLKLVFRDPSDLG